MQSPIVMPLRSQALMHPDPPVLADPPRLLDMAGPRYTSYPTADRFVEAFGAAQYLQALSQRAQGAARAAPVSVYVHIPFCESQCSDCACYQIITRNHERGAEYLQLLQQELDLHTAELGCRTPLCSLHLGGGSPAFLRDHELARLLTLLRLAFRFEPQAEMAIRVDPRTADAARLARLAAMGFNRVSIGVLDLDPKVQAAVGRVQSFEGVSALLQAAPRLGFVSADVDLVYGLPQQTVGNFTDTVARVAALRPTRIAVGGYTYLPQRFKAQRRIDSTALPSAASRVQMLANATASLVASGYVSIGMGDFALPGDELAVAKRQGRLQRNTQGYTARADGDVIGLGISAVGRVGATYSQNIQSLGDYRDALQQRTLPVVRGLTLSRDDLLRRSVIMALLCQGRVDLESISIAHLVDPREVFCDELTQLAAMAEAGLVRLTEGAIEVTPLGWSGVGAIAMVFDRHLRADARRADCSRAL